MTFKKKSVKSPLQSFTGKQLAENVSPWHKSHKSESQNFSPLGRQVSSFLAKPMLDVELDTVRDDRGFFKDEHEHRQETLPFVNMADTVRENGPRPPSFHSEIRDNNFVDIS